MTQLTTAASIGRLVRDARKQRGLTQHELASLLSTSQSAIHRIESGNQNLSLEMINRIAQALESPLIVPGGRNAMNLSITGETALHGSITTRSSKNAAVALLGPRPARPDVVVSGINRGANLGHDVTYSGTVAAAMEAAIFGLPAVAVSLDSYESQEFGLAARVGAGVVAKVQEHGLPAGTLLNVNVPPLAPGELAGTAVTRMGRRVYRDVLVDRRDPRGRPYYWIGGEPPSGHLDEGTDIWAVAQGYVSITPIHLDMTAHDLIPNLEAWSLTELSTR